MFSITKGSFSHEPGYEGVSNVSGVGMIASSLETLGSYAPSGSSSGLSSHKEGFMPAAISVTPGSQRPTQDERRMCRFCGSVSSPVWRKGPSGPQVGYTPKLLRRLDISNFFSFVFIRILVCRNQILNLRTYNKNYE